MTHHAIFLDIETTGLDMHKDFILEIGMVLVNTQGWVPEGFWSSYVSEEGWQERLRDNEYVFNMHQKSELFKDMPPVSPAFTYEAVAERMIEQLDEWKELTGGKPVVWGSSVHFDRKFLNVKMRNVDDKFSHRNSDSSAVLERMRITHPHIYTLVTEEPEFKGRRGAHRVIPDCLDSVTIERLLDKHLYNNLVTTKFFPGGYLAENR